MVFFNRHLVGSAAFVALCSPSYADVTAEDVWEDWRTYITNFGYDVSGQESRTGNQLTISSVVMSAANEGTGDAQITMDQVVMTERADGTVSIDLPGVMPFQMSAPNERGGTTRVSLDYKQEGLTILASGSPNALRYDYEAEAITLETTGFEVNGKLLSPATNMVEVSFEDMEGTTTMLLDAKRRYAQNLTVASMRYAVNMSDAASGNAVEMTGQAQNLTFGGESALPLRGVRADDVDAMLAAGLETNGAFSFAANATQLRTVGGKTPFAGSFLSGAGTLSVEMDQSGLSYTVEQNDVRAELITNQLPLPLSVEVAQSAFNFTTPIRKSDASEDFALGFQLNDFTVSEVLWSMLDPSGELPRDPATISLDLAGKAKLLFDFFKADAAALAAAGDTSLAELEKLDINGLQIKAVGAELTGAGGFTFTNPPGGAPKPTGTVDLKLQGGNTLINKLVAVGILPEQQAMGARMMMGLLAIPGDTPDTLNSKIEINQQGHVLANGQRIQ